MPELLDRIHPVLDGIDHAVIACSGGIDSSLLALVAHRRLPGRVTVAHAISPAVPPEATERVRGLASQHGWTLSIVRSGEFQDENYLSNPVNRCYFCKSNLYDSLVQIAAAHEGATIMSGANLDDLGEYRPGLDAAAERGVRHPWIEAKFAKSDIRALARELDAPFAELPSSPCLASRLYTGTRVTAERLRAVHACETRIKQQTGLAVVRCRVRGDRLIVEVGAGNRAEITPELLAGLAALAATFEPGITSAMLDAEAYRPGRAFVGGQVTSGFVHDGERMARLGMPEAIFCEGKDGVALRAILSELSVTNGPVLFTRLATERHAELAGDSGTAMNYDPRSQTGFLNGTFPRRPGSVAVVTAGTSDLRVASEAARTLRFAGVTTDLVADVGVAGIHRLFARLDHIRTFDVVIVVAGWDAALASVMGGLVGQPVIAVPSSTGYGVAAGGVSALHAMLSSCGQGVLVTNIDNGFGAACGAIRMLNMAARNAQ